MRISFYAMALMVALDKETKLRKGTRRAVLELRMEGCRDKLFKALRLAGDPCCPTCGDPGQPIAWSSPSRSPAVEYLCHRCEAFFWVEDPLGRTKKLRAGRAYSQAQHAERNPSKASHE